MCSQRVLIVGGVAGGASCAARLRRLDENAEIVIFERGGNVSFANCGLPYYVGKVIAKRDALLVATPESFQKFFNIEVRVFHEVVGIDRAGKTVEVKNLQTGHIATESYDTLVLAPGASPIRPKLPGVDLDGIFSLRNLDDVDRIYARIADREAKRAVVVGAGYIGLEMIENFHRRGVHVRAFELLDRVMPTMDPEMVTPVHQELKAKGVDLRLSNGVTAFQPGPEETINVVPQTGDPVPADVVILSIGVRPDAGLAKQAGLEMGDLGGIRVDDRMRTSDASIFAVGDAVEVRDWITGRWTLVPLAGPASRQGRIAADVIAGRDSRFRGTQGTAVVGVFDLTLGMTGANEKTLREAGIAYAKTYTHSLDHAGYYPGASMMAIKLLYTPDTGRLLGAQAVGKSGVDKRIDVLAMTIQKHGTVYDLEEAELCYAPQYGSARDPVNIAGFVAGNRLRGDVDVVSWDEWQKRRKTDGDSFVVIDVRPRAAHAKNSVPDSINIPLTELRGRLEELPRDREIWVHCMIGQTSYNAARLLAQHGFRVRNLTGGINSYMMQPE
jgi:NADPH-dependent 2,4-dienoyl-CoA reductase/sulfur reductase-like enzyme/rhodanese-related sulfurtransferase